MNKKKYFIYARSATKLHNGENTNISRQIETLKEFAKQSGFEVADVISEYGSGLNDERPTFLQMLQRLKKGEAKGVLCTDWSRLTRDLTTYVKLKDMFDQDGIEIITFSNEKGGLLVRKLFQDFIECPVCGNTV